MCFPNPKSSFWNSQKNKNGPEASKQSSSPSSGGWRDLWELGGDSADSHHLHPEEVCEYEEEIALEKAILVSNARMLGIRSNTPRSKTHSMIRMIVKERNASINVGGKERERLNLGKTALKKSANNKLEEFPNTNWAVPRRSLDAKNNDIRLDEKGDRVLSLDTLDTTDNNKQSMTAGDEDSDVRISQLIRKSGKSLGKEPKTGRKWRCITRAKTKKESPMKKTLGPLGSMGSPRFLRTLHGIISPKKLGESSKNSPSPKQVREGIALTNEGEVKRRLLEDHSVGIEAKKARISEENGGFDKMEITVNLGVQGCQTP